MFQFRFVIHTDVRTIFFANKFPSEKLSRKQNSCLNTSLYPISNYGQQRKHFTYKCLYSNLTSSLNIIGYLVNLHSRLIVKTRIVRIQFYIYCVRLICIKKLATCHMYFFFHGFFIREAICPWLTLNNTYNNEYI